MSRSTLNNPECFEEFSPILLCCNSTIGESRAVLSWNARTVLHLIFGQYTPVEIHEQHGLKRLAFNFKLSAIKRLRVPKVRQGFDGSTFMRGALIYLGLGVSNRTFLPPRADVLRHLLVRMWPPSRPLGGTLRANAPTLASIAVVHRRLLQPHTPQTFVHLHIPRSLTGHGRRHAVLSNSPDRSHLRSPSTPWRAVYRFADPVAGVFSICGVLCPYSFQFSHHTPVFVFSMAHEAPFPERPRMIFNKALHQKRGQVAAAAAVLIMALTGSAHADTIKGIASVIDGDTIEIHGQSIRLEGIDAPESGQFCLDAHNKNWRCGQYAAWALNKVVGQEYVACRIEGKDRYGRFLGTCFHHQQNLNKMMVLLGLALAYRKYSSEYIDAENTAMNSNLGMWKGQFIPPWDWRKGVRFDE